MSAEEALAYGLIDEIVQPNDEKLRQLSLPPPSQSPELFNEIPKSAIDYEFGKLVSWLEIEDLHSHSHSKKNVSFFPAEQMSSLWTFE